MLPVELFCSWVSLSFLSLLWLEVHFVGTLSPLRQVDRSLFHHPSKDTAVLLHCSSTKRNKDLLCIHKQPTGKTVTVVLVNWDRIFRITLACE